MNPTYQSGFYAPGRGTALHPELWDGCLGAWNPGLGPSGLVLRDWSGANRHATGTGAFVVSGTGYSVQGNVVGDIFSASIASLPQPWSLSIWCYRSSYLGSQNAFTLAPTSGSLSAFYPFDTYAGNGIRWFFGSNIVDQNSGAVPVCWHHFMLVSRTTTNHEAYVNGVSVGTSSTSQTLGPNITIGILGWVGVQVFSGNVDDVMLFRSDKSKSVNKFATRRGIAYERAPRKFYSLPAAAGNPTGILINNLQSIRLGL